MNANLQGMHGQGMQIPMFSPNPMMHPQHVDPFMYNTLALASAEGFNGYALPASMLAGLQDMQGTFIPQDPSAMQFPQQFVPNIYPIAPHPQLMQNDMGFALGMGNVMSPPVDGSAGYPLAQQQSPQLNQRRSGGGGGGGGELHEVYDSHLKAPIAVQPMDALPTVGSRRLFSNNRNGGGGAHGGGRSNFRICDAFQNGRCVVGEDCQDIHIRPDYLFAVRNQMTTWLLSKENEFKDTVTRSPQTTFRIFYPDLKEVVDVPIAALRFTRGLYVDPTTRARRLRSSNPGQFTTAAAQVPTVCGLYVVDPSQCNWGRWCNQVHVDATWMQAKMSEFVTWSNSLGNRFRSMPTDHLFTMHDPQLKASIQIPKAAISEFTRGLFQGSAKKAPSVCMLFQKGRCAAHGCCNQIHVVPQYLDVVRRYSTESSEEGRQVIATQMSAVHEFLASQQQQQERSANPAPVAAPVAAPIAAPLAEKPQEPMKMQFAAPTMTMNATADSPSQSRLHAVPKQTIQRAELSSLFQNPLSDNTDLRQRMLPTFSTERVSSKSGSLSSYPVAAAQEKSLESSFRRSITRPVRDKRVITITQLTQPIESTKNDDGAPSISFALGYSEPGDNADTTASTTASASATSNSTDRQRQAGADATRGKGGNSSETTTHMTIPSSPNSATLSRTRDGGAASTSAFSRKNAGSLGRNLNGSTSSMPTYDDNPALASSGTVYKHNPYAFNQSTTSGQAAFPHFTAVDGGKAAAQSSTAVHPFPGLNTRLRRLGASNSTSHFSPGMPYDSLRFSPTQLIGFSVSDTAPIPIDGFESLEDMHASTFSNSCEVSGHSLGGSITSHLVSAESKK